MEEKLINGAVENFRNGYSCSESIVKAAIDLGLAHEAFLRAATAFSGGMGSGCLCGAISGAQMVIGSIYGQNARPYAQQFIKAFMAENKATCCRVLTKGLDFHSPERKEHCVEMVSSAAKILFQIIKEEISSKKI